MAQVVVWGHRQRLTERRAALSGAIHGAIMAALEYPAEKRFQRFVPLDDDDFVHPEDRGDDYTIIEISMFEGRSDAAKRALIRELFTFVLVPGIGVSSNHFERLAPNLNEFGPVHALDLPGFGGVPHPDHDLTIREYADLVGRVIDELGLDDPILVGHSMGTQVVVDLVARRPRLSTLILIGPVINPAERRLALQVVRFLQAAVHEPGRIKALAIGSYLLCGVKWFSRILPRMMRFPIEQAMPHIAADTLIIRGEFDAVAPRAWVERAGRLVPRSRLWEIPTAAHSVMHAHAEEVARLSVEHARRPVAPSEPKDLNVLPDPAPADEQGEFAPTAGDVAASIAGSVTELRGVLTGDDDAIAAGKTQHAERWRTPASARRTARADRRARPRRRPSRRERVPGSRAQDAREAPPRRHEGMRDAHRDHRGRPGQPRLPPPPHRRPRRRLLPRLRRPRPG